MESHDLSRKALNYCSNVVLESQLYFFQVGKSILLIQKYEILCKNIVLVFYLRCACHL